MGLDDHPVVHVSFVDALAFAQLAGKDVPTMPNGSSPRGEVSTAGSSPGVISLPPGARHMANTWQRNFPA